MAEETQPLLDQVLSGHSRELKILAASGILPLPQEELIRVQIILADDEDAEVAGRAREGLQGLEPRVIATFVQDEADAAALSYCAQAFEHPVILEAILRRRNVPHDLLIEMAPGLSAELQEILLLRQDAIVDRPQILDALAQNPALTSYSRRRIDEYRHHLLGRGTEARPEPEAPDEEEDLEEGPELSEEEMAAAISTVTESVEPEGEVDERTGLSEGQIRALPIPLRMQLARGASRTLRSILIRDTNPMVACSVLNYSAVSEQEVELIANNRLVVEDVIVLITRKRQWVQKYNILLALVRNPRTPIGFAMRSLGRLSLRDLRGLSRDRNVPEALRKRALTLYRQKIA